VACELCQAIQMPQKSKRAKVSPAAASSEPASPTSAGSELAREMFRDELRESEELAKGLWTVLKREGEAEDDGVRVYLCPEHERLSDSQWVFLGPHGKNVIMCKHRNVKKSCIKCPKGIYCQHNKIRRFCHICKKIGTGGQGLCDAHHVRKDSCAGCKGLPGHGTRVCEHGRHQSQCADCKQAGTGGWLLCDAHWQRRSRCSVCAKKVKKQTRSQPGLQAPPLPSATAFQATLDQGHRDRMANMVANARVPPVPAGGANGWLVYTFGSGWVPLSRGPGQSHSLS
jgi:hypothetical protein